MKYRRKPEVVEACQITEEMHYDMIFTKKQETSAWFTDFPQWLKDAGMLNPHVRNALYVDEKDVLILRTWNGPNEVAPGDWIVKDIKGELSWFKNEHFCANYESILENE